MTGPISFPSNAITVGPFQPLPIFFAASILFRERRRHVRLGRRLAPGLPQIQRLTKLSKCPLPGCFVDLAIFVYAYYGADGDYPRTAGQARSPYSLQRPSSSVLLIPGSGFSRHLKTSTDMAKDT